MGFILKWFVLPIALAAAALFAYRVANPPEKLHVPENGWYGRGAKRDDDKTIRPFTVKVPNDTLQDLKSRLQRARIGHETLEDSDNFEYGFNVNELKKVRDYWLNKYDWTKQEAVLNSWPQFTTEIEGIKVHFYHVKPDAKKYKKVVPLLIVHGWPGNVFEFYKIIPLLSDPAAYKVGDGDLAFEIIAPSIPGYGFSESPRKTGFSQVSAARVFRKLVNRLGHKKFFVQGGDWGSIIVTNLAKIYPESVYGLHTNMQGGIPSGPISLFYTIFGSFFPKLLFAHEHHHTFNFFRNFADIIKESGYMHLQATKPDTVGTALNDSPLGLAAYILEKFSTWTNAEYRNLPDGGLTKKFTLDELLTIVTIYWTQGNIVQSQRFYKEFFLDSNNIKLNSEYGVVPTAHAQFANEFFDKAPPEITAQSFNLTSFAVIPNGGHFAAFEEPKALALHVFSFVRGLVKDGVAK